MPKKYEGKQQRVSPRLHTLEKMLSIKKRTFQSAIISHDPRVTSKRADYSNVRQIVNLPIRGSHLRLKDHELESDFRHLPLFLPS